MKNASIIGGGLVGSLWAIYLNRLGYKVSVFEKRSDLRKTDISAGKSINLAVSYRGWKALDEVGVGDAIRALSIPMYGRTIHKSDGSTHYSPYGLDGQAIYSVSRGDINRTLMDHAEKSGLSEFYFNTTCTEVDLDKNIAYFNNPVNKTHLEVKSDVIFATDGAFSSVRYQSMQKSDRFDYSQKFIEDSYKEILLPANADGTHQMDKNSLHVWPRGRFMLIALPNFDGSFTCTLFMPKSDHEYAFDNLKDAETICSFFQNLFPDFFELMPNIGEKWNDHPESSLALIRCFPWHINHTVLMGDAAHATVPFFGQGMNAGFEDCTVMNQLAQKYGNNWSACFSEFEKLRKPNGDAVQDLSLQNYLVMRDKVNDEAYNLQQKFEKRVHALYPEQYLPLYSMVTFSDIEYQTALEKGLKQEKEMNSIMNELGITTSTNEEEIDHLIHSKFKK